MLDLVKQCPNAMSTSIHWLKEDVHSAGIVYFKDMALTISVEQNAKTGGKRLGTEVINM